MQEKRREHGCQVTTPDVLAQQQRATNPDDVSLYMVDQVFAYLVAGPLHLPVVRAPSQRLAAENLPPEVKACWMVQGVQVLRLQHGFTTSN